MKKTIKRGASCASCSSSQILGMVVRELEEEFLNLAENRRTQRRPRRAIRPPPLPESNNESPTFSSSDEDVDSSRYY
ncbi:unnamed protein product [Cochlearia groenlandica]